MRYSALATLLPLLFKGVTSATVPAMDDTKVIFHGVHTIPESQRVAPITNSTNGDVNTQADSCYTTSLNIGRGDIWNMRFSLLYDDPNHSTYMPALSWVSWSRGSALLCIYNDYLFENTHIINWEAGWVTAYIQDTCGYTGDGVCQGGSATCSGDSGLSLRAVLRRYGNENC